MNIGLLGFGVVGRGVYEITTKRDDMQVTKVLCLEDIKLPDAEAVKDIRAIVEDVVKIVGDGGVRQAQLPAAQNPDHLHILPGGDDLVNTPAYGSEAQ